jgi:TusA-related sulfurtransferase/uncharacterized membrane protein YgdD (TMEM256/DUF423 family)
MQTGENEQGLRKIIDLTRLISIVILILHFYYYCYGAFKEWQLTSAITDRLLANIAQTGLFKQFHYSKFIAIGFLIISLIGARGRKNDQLQYRTAAAYLCTGALLYFISAFILMATNVNQYQVMVYILVTCLGYILLLTGGVLLSRIIRQSLHNDVFNTLNETFPQEERLLQNEFSINLPARYYLKNNIRKSWINIINPFRGLLVMGSPGSGKSYFIIQHIIKQHLQKGFTMFVYDFKFDDLSRITYNHFLKHRNVYKVQPQFYVINFDDLQRSHRSNPLDPSTLFDVTDANESSRTIMLGLNREWIKKQGDFFVESPINFVTALIWFLYSYKGGQFCTLPHVIELAQVEYSKLFSVLRTEPQIEVLINPFVTAYLNDAMEQLEGQIASAKISLARLSSPNIYYILSGNDFTLDINNPEKPKIVCMGSNPQKTQTYGAVLSLYISALTRLINKQGKHKCSLIFDEFPTIYFNGIDSLIATARSNKVATTLAVQDISQLKLHYGKEQADVIINITGNVIAGQVTGESARQLSERFGKIMQDRQSLSINSNDTSITKSKQLDSAIPPSTIASLSSGEFVGIVADDPTNKIELKSFCCEVMNDHEALKKEHAGFKSLPVVANIDNTVVNENYLKIKKDIAGLIETELERMLNTPELECLLVKTN